MKEVSEIGLNDLTTSYLSLPGLLMYTTLALLQILGLYSAVMVASKSLPSLVRWLFLRGFS